MTVLDFTKKTTPVIDKLIKLGFHYESTDKTEAEGIRNPPQLITTWENVMNGVILKSSTHMPCPMTKTTYCIKRQPNTSG